MKRRADVWLLMLGTGLIAACAGDAAGPVPAVPPPTQDAATRAQPVVAGRPARVFVFAGVDGACKPLAEPVLNISVLPSQGDISFKPGQETTIAASAQGTCLGAKAKGTGVYYTARAGAKGRDRFAIDAKLASGETTTRHFDVTIAD